MYVHIGKFAIVMNKSGNFGVADCSDELIIPDNHRHTEFEIIGDTKNADYGRNILFKLQNKDGTYSISINRI